MNKNQIYKRKLQIQLIPKRNKLLTIKENIEKKIGRKLKFNERKIKRDM